MRRGHHHGSGGWRNDNQRNFRPRGGGTPHFRPPRNYGPPIPPRFPLAGPRHHGPPPFINPQRPPEPSFENNDRNQFGGRPNNQRHERTTHHVQRQILPFLQRIRRNEDPHKYFDNNTNNNPYHVNSMGDVDHRQLPQNNEPNIPPLLSTPLINPWSHPPPNFEDKSHKPYSYHDRELNKPQSDYTGHRPPSSDHYGGNPVSAIDSTNTFSRSVNDTVDLVRKRLQSRESQPSQSLSRQSDDNENLSRETASSYSKQQDPPTKKRTFRQKTNVKTNCDAMKNKIVHQLFKMDKDKIHKLMDNPNCSDKFEFAISSLITESQISYNNHLRSAAEKSLSTSAEFMHNDNNTIYEDTFMKQMQCILDPQDTVLLEDIKPMVLAELCKVLQLNDLEQAVEEQPMYSQEAQTNFDQYPSDTYDPYDSYPPYEAYDANCDNFHEDVILPSTDCERLGSNTEPERKHDTSQTHFESNQLYERRQRRASMEQARKRRQSCDVDHGRSERHNERRDEDRYNRSKTPLPHSSDKWRLESRPLPPSSDVRRCRSPLQPQIGDIPKSPLPVFFDSNVEILSDDEDPFAELDKQYHVAVDHNFIEPDDLTFSPAVSCGRPATPSPYKDRLQTPPPCDTNVGENIKVEKSWNNEESRRITVKNEKDINCQPQDSNHKSPSKRRRTISERTSSKTEIKQELSDHNTMSSKSITPVKQELTDKLIQDKTSDSKGNKDKMSSVRSEINHSIAKSTTTSRKRSTDQKPSHRKEKRKKSDTSPSEPSKEIVNKNIIINVNDCVVKSEKSDPSKSIFNLFFSKDKSNKDSTKESKKLDSSDKAYSDKYVKRKETPSKKKDTCSDKKRDSSSSSHSIVSPSDNGGETPTKVDGKSKLKPIDMFTEHPRKQSSVHHAHRNTAAAPVASKISIEPIKPPVMQTGRKLSRRHIATQVSPDCTTKESQTADSRACTSRHVQTERKKTITRAAQTTPVEFKTKSNSSSTDGLERMKEIDMEIQMLLQEKFKLYSSLESKDSCSSTMQSLGMAVLNMTPLEGTKANEGGDSLFSEDAIVEEFTNIPVEELEQIALESVEHHTPTASSEKRSKRLKAISEERRSSESPNSRKSKRKAKTPNISLIEQIITDDRPLEEIISLDDLEIPVTKSKKKSHKAKSKPKKKVAKKITIKPVREPEVPYVIKECSIVLIRDDFSRYLKPDVELKESREASVVRESVPDTIAEASVVEESVVNDIQFDMLDVSEDIVIGDVCEVKADKDSSDTSNISISEEVILDNSQSSMDEVVPESGLSAMCKMYDFSADENLRRDTITVSGNGDAVLAMECMENEFIAACLDGNVYHFSGDGKLLNTLRGSNLAVTCLTIVKEKHGTTVYTGSLDSRIRYYDLETGLEKGPECNVLSPIQTMDRAWDTVFVGTRTGFVLQFECKNNMLIPVSTVKFSEQSILALRAMKEGPRKVLLVAARSEPVTVKDAQTGLLLRTFEGPKMTVYTLLFEDGKVYCGTSSHLIHAFDYASGSHVWSHSGGKGAVCLLAAGGLVFAGCYDGCVYVYREGEPAPLAQLRGPSLMLLSLAVLGTKLIAGYKDRSLYIWKIPLSIIQEMIL